MPHIIVERSFDPPLTQEDLDSVARRVSDCLELYRVNWIRSYLSADRRRMVCEYDAPDAQSVREVQNTAQARFDRVWPAEVMEPS